MTVCWTMSASRADRSPKRPASRFGVENNPRAPRGGVPSRSSTMYYLHKPRLSREEQRAVGRAFLTVVGMQAACLVAVRVDREWKDRRADCGGCRTGKP